MVTVNSYKIREDKEGKPFITLELSGDLEMVQSSKTGRFYATNRSCYISSTFDELTAQRMIGKQMPGSIGRIECDPYDYTIQDTGEVIQLSHNYSYIPEQQARSSEVLQTV